MVSKVAEKNSRPNGEAGNSIVEYAIIVAMISVAVIASINVMTGKISNLLTNVIVPSLS